MKSTQIVLLSAFLLGIVGGISGNLIAAKLNSPTEQDLIKEFYAVETAVHVSPHSLRKQMAKGDRSFILVDLRSQEEYEKEHITGALNIPAYRNRDESAYNDIDRIVGEFAKLPKDKDIIVYCYSIPCMTGRKIGKMLTEHDIYVQHLGIGWNEWRYHWTLWNHEHEWDKTKVEDYITKGKELGKMKTGLPANACPIEGNFGC